MDALKFDDKACEKQFKINNVLRELNKCFVAFTPLDRTRFQTISTGKWGCGAFKGDP